MIDPSQTHHALEAMLHFRSVDRFLYRASDLHTLHGEEFQGLIDRVQKCHIYLLGTRPRASIRLGSVVVSESLVRFEIIYRTHGVEHSQCVAMRRSLFLPKEASFEAAPYPHRELISKDAEGKIVAQTLLANIVHLYDELADGAKDIEVLYVGRGTADSASDRLRSHSTLQKMLGNLAANEPDSEVFVLIYSFEFKKPGVARVSGGTDIEAEADHLRRVLAFKPDRDQQIELVEGACIAYFRPTRYNTQLLDFPCNKPKSLDAVRSGGFFSIVVELDNYPIGGVRTFSDNVDAAAYHCIQVDLRRQRVITNRESSSETDEEAPSDASN